MIGMNFERFIRRTMRQLMLKKEMLILHNVKGMNGLNDTGGSIFHSFLLFLASIELRKFIRLDKLSAALGKVKVEKSLALRVVAKSHIISSIIFKKRRLALRLYGTVMLFKN